MALPQSVSTNIYSDLLNATELRKHQDEIIAEIQILLESKKPALIQDVYKIRGLIIKQIMQSIDDVSCKLTVHNYKERRYVKILTSNISKILQTYHSIQT